jgi:hypothetical protein
MQFIPGGHRGLIRGETAHRGIDCRIRLSPRSRRQQMIELYISLPSFAIGSLVRRLFASWRHPHLIYSDSAWIEAVVALRPNGRDGNCFEWLDG